MSDEISIERLYHPDGKGLGTLVAGLSGSGKTTAVITTLQNAIKTKGFDENHRFVIIDPKHQPGDYDLLADPITDMKKMRKSIRKNRVSLYYPSIGNLENEVQTIVDYMFLLADSSEASFTFVLDEASALIQSNRIPDGLKRVAVQGRAKRIKPVFISQRPIMNRWTDANLSSGLFFRILPVDGDLLEKRWKLNYEENMEILNENEFSFVFLDLETAKSKIVPPVPLPKPRPKEKKRGFSRFFRMD